MTSADVSKTTPMLTNNEEILRDIRSFDDALALLNNAGVNIVDYSTEYGDGFTLLRGDHDKATLVGIPFIILGVKLAKGDYNDGSEFAIVHAVCKDGRKVIIVDGGTGIAAQAIKMIERGHDSGVMVPNGLRRSDYEYTDDKGNKAPATTFYLSN